MDQHVLLVCYAKSGTETAYGGMRCAVCCYARSGTETAYGSSTSSSTASTYARSATSYLASYYLLTSRPAAALPSILRVRYALSGTELCYAVTACCYAVSGTSYDMLLRGYVPTAGTTSGEDQQRQPGFRCETKCKCVAKSKANTCNSGANCTAITASLVQTVLDRCLFFFDFGVESKSESSWLCN
eukprot:3171716-Rhodomonas_salina.1